MLKGAIDLANGISLSEALVRVESVSDNYSAEVMTIPMPDRDSTGREYLSLTYQEQSGTRHVAFRAQVFANEEMLKANRPVCYIEQDNGMNSFRLFPDESVTGMALLDLAETNLIELFPGLARVE